MSTDSDRNNWLGQVQELLKNVQNQVTVLRKENKNLQVYRAYCLYNQGAYRTICTKENGIPIGL